LGIHKIKQLITLQSGFCRGEYDAVRPKYYSVTVPFKMANKFRKIG